MPKNSRRSQIPISGLNPVQRVRQEAQALDDRRQQQINNQIAAINRVLAAWQGDQAWTYDDEMEALHKLLATAQVRVAELEGQLREQSEGENVGKRKDAFYAGFAAGETEDSVDESWAEYKDQQDNADTDEGETDDAE